MLRSLLIGLSAGSRALTPLATVSEAARSGQLAETNPAVRLLAHPLFSAGSKALAAGELWGDKLKSAPDRIVPAGIVARLLAGGLAGAALAPRRHLVLGAALGAGAAVAASYVTFGARMKALRRWGQTPTGLVEDALTLGAAQWVVRGAK